MYWFILAYVALLGLAANAYVHVPSQGARKPQASNSIIFSSPTQASSPATRRETLEGAVAAFGFTAFSSLPAWAKGDDASLKGTKADPKYTNCVSTCIFECTKEKGVEQKTRVECLPGCKEKCATSKEQLMVGTPK
mmetsp:Transcript_521/g.914  ORF Transcript_521/g.914 Transcript_521/m.914 type:complete len:136 (+) Transcript_521:42-449(+)|eukprot:CAMPEP_0182463680 /NCGR_PEP_ID=MMETSP1319-20130603/7837_1 /TAXON_ID=172717 /ORGANISM="Bolidomonas pacifica, Strain RCC208" /LENGTH=135 /DNA_ID=CAMNT_0024663253 /DNA_START=12 /DNA_END=419 /DNA_ORIENTATION=-